jgi:hypothetical protein
LDDFEIIKQHLHSPGASHALLALTRVKEQVTELQKKLDKINTQKKMAETAYSATCVLLAKERKRTQERSDLLYDINEDLDEAKIITAKDIEWHLRTVHKIAALLETGDANVVKDSGADTTLDWIKNYCIMRQEQLKQAPSTSEDTATLREVTEAIAVLQSLTEVNKEEA